MESDLGEGVPNGGKEAERYPWSRFVADSGAGRQVDILGSPAPRWAQPADTLRDRPCVVLLAEPGMGKTDVLRTLAQPTRDARGLYVDLATYDEKALEALFDEEVPAALAAAGPTMRLELLLDSVDEARVESERLEKSLLRHLRSRSLDPDRVRLRMACRTLHWPYTTLDEELARKWRVEKGALHLRLLPLTLEDIVYAAGAQLGEARAATFLGALEEHERLRPLCGRPITLQLLLDVFEDEGEAPVGSLRDLFERASLRMFDDHNRWLERKVLRGDLDRDTRRRIGGLMAGAGLFTGKTTLWRSTPSAVRRHALEPSELAGCKLRSHDGDDVLEVTGNMLEEVEERGPFAPRGAQEYQWTHRTVAEYLAARWLDESVSSDEKLVHLLTRDEPSPEGDEPRRRIVPQLADLAAWVAACRPALFGQLCRLDPVPLLAANVADLDDASKRVLLRALLEAVASEEVAHDFDLDGYLSQLDFPTMGDDLRTWIADGTRDFVARRLAVSIADACNRNDLDDALRFALHEDDEETGSVFRLAARALARSLARQEQWDELRALLDDSAMERDTHDTLRGEVLEVLWPTHLSLRELLRYLRPPRNASYFGTYHVFLTDGVVERLSEAQLLPFVDWYFSQAQAFWLDTLGKNLAAVLRDHLAAGSPLAERLAEHLTSRVAHTSHDAFKTALARALAESTESRRALLRAIATQAEVDEGWARMAVRDLVQPDDAAWLVALVPSLDERPARFVIGALRNLLDLRDVENVATLVRASAEHDGLAEWVADLTSEFGPSPVDIAIGETRRVEDLLQDKRKPDPTVQTGIAECLERTDASAFVRLIMLLSLDEFGDQSGGFGTVTAMPGWRRASGATRTKIVDAAVRLLLEGDPETTRWLGTNQGSHVAMAGVRAFILLAETAQNRLEQLPERVWRTWAPALLMQADSEIPEPSHAVVLEEAARQAPDALADALSREAESDSPIPFSYYARKAEAAWCPEVAEALLGALRHLPVDRGLLAVAELLCRRGVDLSAELDDDDPDRRATFVAALLRQGAERHWGTLEHHLEDDALARRAFELAAKGTYGDERIVKGIESLDVLVWLTTRVATLFPPEDDPPRQANRVMSGLPSTSWLRSQLIRRIAEHGTWEAVAALHRLRERFPGDGLNLRWHIGAATTSARSHTWVPWRLQDLLEIVLEGRRAVLYLSSRFASPLRDPLRVLLERSYVVVRTEHRARPDNPFQSIDADIRRCDAVVQALDHDTGLGNRGQIGGAFLEQECKLAEAHRKAMFVGVLTTPADCPNDLGDYLEELRHHRTLLRESEDDTLLRRLCQSVDDHFGGASAGDGPESVPVPSRERETRRQWTHDVFISYAHEDRRVVERLHRQLVRRWLPWRRPLVVYRDAEHLTADVLGPQIVTALGESRRLLICCSEHAAESDWVARELEAFLQTHGMDDVMLCHVDRWDEDELARVLPDGCDDEWASDRLRPVVFNDDEHRANVHPIVATLYGLENASALRTQRWRVSIAIGLVAVLVIAGMAGWMWWSRTPAGLARQARLDLLEEASRNDFDHPDFVLTCAALAQSGMPGDGLHLASVFSHDNYANLCRAAAAAASSEPACAEAEQYLQATGSGERQQWPFAALLVAGQCDRSALAPEPENREQYAVAIGRAGRADVLQELAGHDTWPKALAFTAWAHLPAERRAEFPMTKVLLNHWWKAHASDALTFVGLLNELLVQLAWSDGLDAPELQEMLRASAAQALDLPMDRGAIWNDVQQLAAHLAQAGHVDDATGLLDAAPSPQGKQPDSMQWAEGWLWRGLALERLGRDAQHARTTAEELFRRPVTGTRTYRELYGVIDVFGLAGDWTEAFTRPDLARDEATRMQLRAYVLTRWLQCGGTGR